MLPATADLVTLRLLSPLMLPATADLSLSDFLSPLKPALGDSPRPTHVFFQDYGRKLAAGFAAPVYCIVLWSRKG